MINVSHRLASQREPKGGHPSPGPKSGRKRGRAEMGAGAATDGAGGDEGGDGDGASGGGGADGGGSGATEVKSNSDGETLSLDHEYWALKEKVVEMEARLLRILGFNLELVHP